jgi:hypothetical protein
VILCHQAENKVSEGSVAIASALRGVRMLRYPIILTDLFVSVLLPLAINHSFSSIAKQPDSSHNLRFLEFQI